MTFRQLEIFTAVCECGSITTASREYHISPQGISHTIKELEEELGCLLLKRSVSGVAVTERGSFFYDECRNVLKWKDGIVERLRAWEGEPEETVLLGMAYGMIPSMPDNLFSDFEALHPGIKIRYADNTDLALEAQLDHREFDFCLNTGIMDKDRFLGKTLSSQPIMLCIPQNHALFRKASIRMEDLAEQHFVMFSTQFFIRHHFDTSCRRAGFQPILDFVSNDFTSLMALSQRSGALFAIPAAFVESQNAQCRYVPFPDERYCWDVCLVRNQGIELGKGAKLLWEYIESRFAPNGAQSG